MAVNVETPESLSDGDGATASFATGFTFKDAADVVVHVRGADGVLAAKVNGVDYDLSGSASTWPTAGANVVFRAGRIPASGTTVLRRRVTAAAQAVPFGDQAAFRPTLNEQAFDRLTRQLQEERAKAARALSVPVGETGFELPSEAARDGKLLVPDGAALSVLDQPNRVFVTDADGKVLQLGLVNFLTDIGVAFDDYGLLTPPGGEPLDDYGALA